MNITGFFGLTPTDLIGLLILAVIIIVILVVLKFVLKMTVGVLKMGCLVSLLVMVAAAVFMWIV